jgi:hypothetical protein
LRQQPGNAAGQRRAQVRQAGQRFAQGRQITRPGVAQCDAAGDAFDVGDAAQGFSGLASQSTVIFEQCFDRAVPRRRDRPVAQRMVQRMAQQARPHAGDAVVEQRKQRWRRLAAQGFGQFQIAPRGQVEAR